MEKSCSFKRLYGGQCGKDPRSKKDGVIVPLLSCQKDISNHKSSQLYPASVEKHRACATSGIEGRCGQRVSETRRAAGKG